MWEVQYTRKGEMKTAFFCSYADAMTFYYKAEEICAYARVREVEVHYSGFYAIGKLLNEEEV